MSISGASQTSEKSAAPQDTDIVKNSISQRKFDFKNMLKRDFGIDSKTNLGAYCIPYRQNEVEKLVKDTADGSLGPEELFDKGKAIVNVYGRQSLVGDEFINRLNTLLN